MQADYLVAVELLARRQHSAGGFFYAWKDSQAMAKQKQQPPRVNYTAVIRPTNITTEVDGKLCRLWEGTTADGRLLKLCVADSGFEDKVGETVGELMERLFETTARHFPLGYILP